jgi:hypothetical protein
VPGLQPVGFDSNVEQVNFNGRGAPAGTTDVAVALPSTTTTFVAYGPTLTLVTYGTGGADSVTLTPAPAGGLGNVAVAGFRPTFFDAGAFQVNFYGQGRADAVSAPLSTTTRFYAMRPGITLTVTGTTGADTVTILTAPVGGFGSLQASGPGYVPIHFDSAVTNVNFVGLDGNDVVYVDTSSGTNFVTFYAGSGGTRGSTACTDGGGSTSCPRTRRTSSTGDPNRRRAATRDPVCERPGARPNEDPVPTVEVTTVRALAE